jgi:hypothetical protein
MMQTPCFTRSSPFKELTMILKVRSLSAYVLLLVLAMLGQFSLFAQSTYSSNIHSLPNEQMFSTIRRVAGQFSNSGGYSSWYGEYDGKIDLISCGVGADKILSGDDPYADPVDLAIWINVLSRQLKQDGTYEVAQPYLSRLIAYGNAETRRIDNGTKQMNRWGENNKVLLENMAQALNVSIGRKRYIVEGGCGAGEIDVLVKIPVGATASFINLFRFSLCQARGLDPWNKGTCFGWKEVGKLSLSLSGAYRYLLVSANGNKKSGDFQINQKEELALMAKGLVDEDHPYVVSLR